MVNDSASMYHETLLKDLKILKIELETIRDKRLLNSHRSMKIIDNYEHPGFIQQHD
jgi:hypothetical protein